MAINPIINAIETAAHEQHVDAQGSGIPIEAWTEQTTEALHAMIVSSPEKTNAGNDLRSLSIPLDEPPFREGGKVPILLCEGVTQPKESGFVKKRDPVRRDSLKRREALLKGKEGSRRRQRWENDHLLNNPYAQPPLPSDWEVHPTYTQHVVPYYLAPLWDNGLSKSFAERKNAGHLADRRHTPLARIPRDLKEKLKRAKGARSLLQDLEEQVRMFIKGWEERLERGGLSELDSEDEEIVFVGRNGQMNDMLLMKDSNEDLKSQKLVYESFIGDQGASFGRWLVHSIASYYGLSTWSITVGDPARREAYVGITETKIGIKSPNGIPLSSQYKLPEPLYVLV
ncbi:MAG: hypothetical protein M1827_003892 [Pycnora praestabilis]|nr:MAG: hypothetical protein M1827_003892 [Pycnora praestabilis]